MSNILHGLNRGFVIIGITGPLSSGCTTAANFYHRKLNRYIEKKTTKVLPKFEKKSNQFIQTLETKKKSIIREALLKMTKS